MTVSEQVKAIDNQIGQSEPKYSLDRQTVKISALLSGNVGKLEFLRGGEV